MPINQPNLFLLGAPKCGTTAIYTYLGTHPQIFFPQDKEPHFYAEDFPSHRTCTTGFEYQRLYAAVQPEHRVIGDASVLMLYSQTALGRILADCPQARFVVAIRNPAELVVSLHRQFVLSGREEELDFVTAWQREIELARPFRNLSVMRVEQPSLAQANADQLRSTQSLLHYPRYGKLSTHLSQVMTLVDPRRVHVLFLEDIQTKPRDVYLHLLQFLELPDDGRGEFPRVNEGRQHRLPGLSRMIQSRPWLTKLFKQAGIAATLRSWATRPANKASPPLELQRELCNFFKEEVESLAELTQRDLSHWLRVNEQEP